MRAIAKHRSVSSNFGDTALPEPKPFEIMPPHLRGGFACLAWIGFGLYLVCLSLVPAASHQRNRS